MLTNTGEINAVQFIYQMLKTHNRKKHKPSQILHILQHYQPLPLIKDQMIFLTILSTNYYQNVLNFSLKFNKFKLQIQGVAKEIKEKEIKMGQPQKNKRKKKQTTSNKNINLQEKMQQSLDNPSSVESNSNPSNPDQQRTIALQKNSGNQNSMNRDSSNKEQERQIDPAFREGLDKVSQQIMMDHYSTQYVNLPQIKPMDQISSDSSSRQFGFINNLEEKMRTFLGNSSSQTAEKTQKRKVSRKGNKTSNKVQKLVFDDVTLLENTTMNNSIYNINDSKLSTDANQIEQIRNYQQFQKIMDIRNFPVYQTINQNIIDSQKMLYIKRLSKDLRALRINKKDQLFINNNEEMNHDFAMDYDMNPNITEVPQIHQKHNQSINNKDDLILNRIKFQEKKITIKDCQVKYHKTKASIFMEMLLRMSEGQVELIQTSPSKFSQITIKIL